MSEWPQPVLIGAVQDYFQGERREMRMILAASALTLCAAAAAWWGLRDGFSRGVAATLATVMLLFGAAAVDLLIRDPKIERTLLEGLKGPEAVAYAAAEQERIAQVVRQYPVYRIGGAAAVLAGLFVLWWHRRPWAWGELVGLCAGMGILLLIDHVSAQRARRYLELLASGS